MPLDSKNKTYIAFLTLFAASMMIKSAVFILAVDPIIFNKYPYFARELSAGRDIGERLVDLSPLYLYVVTAFYKIFGPNWDLLAALQIILGSIHCVLIGLIGAKIFNPAVGILASGVLMLYGNIALIESTLEPEAFLFFFNALAVLLLLRAAETDTVDRISTWWLFAGIATGLAAITKANALLMIPGAAFWIWLSAKKTPFWAFGLFLLGAILVIAPVTIRNFVKFNDFVLITADGGKVFFHGNGPGADGLERVDLPDQGFIEEKQGEPDYAHALFRQTARREAGYHLKPSECSSYWVSRTITHIRENPRLALENFVRKTLLFFNNYEIHDLDTTYKGYKTLQRWPLVTAGIITALGSAGMLLFATMFRRLFLAYWIVAIYLVSVIVFFPATRYRMPALPFLSIFAAAFLYELIAFFRKKEATRVVNAFVLVLFFLGTAYLPMKTAVRRFDLWQQISRIHYSLEGRMLFKKGRYAQAAQALEKVVSAAPDFTPAVNYLGKAYAILGDHERAAACFKKVIALSPAVDEGYMNAALLFELRGNKTQAARYFEKALAINPQNVRALWHLRKLTGD